MHQQTLRIIEYLPKTQYIISICFKTTDQETYVLYCFQIMLFTCETTSFITHTFAFSRLLDWSSRRVLGRARGLDNDIGLNSNIVPGPDSSSLRDSYLGYSSYYNEKKVCWLGLIPKQYFVLSKIYIKYNYTFFGYVCEDFCFHNCVIRHLNKCQLINFVKVQHYFLCGDCVLNKYVRMILFHGYQAKKTPTVETTNHFTLAFSHIFDFFILCFKFTQ